MQKLKLPEVSLVMQETRDHKLALLAVENCISKIDFGEVLIFTDSPLEFSPLMHVCNPRIITVPDWPDKVGWCRFNWFGVPPHIRTSHILFCQWDAGTWDTGMWRDEFLDYDLIGAPWWHPDKNVGNTGFCLKSTRLARYIYNNGARFPCDTDVEDDLLCRKYRYALEEKGFVWAPEKVAFDFAYEGAGPVMPKPVKHFGFHGAFNFPLVFDHDKAVQLATLMMESPHIRDSYIMKGFVARNVELMMEIAGDEFEKLRAAAE